MVSTSHDLTPFFLYLAGVLYVVAIAAALLIDDIDVEELLYGAAPFEEGAAGQFLAVAELACPPSVVNILQRDAPGAVNGLYEPHIFAEAVHSLELRLYLELLLFGKKCRRYPEGG